MKVIGCALRKNSKKLETHFVFASRYYFHNEHAIISFILDGMKKYKIKSVMVTIFDMCRICSVQMAAYYKRKDGGSVQETSFRQ